MGFKEIFSSQRMILCIMLFLALVNAYTMRVTLSVAIVRMVKQHHKINKTNTIDVCPRDPEKSHILSQGEYDWSENLQGVILSAFYWGYTITHLPGGLLAEKLGGKQILAVGLLSTAILTILSPVVIAGCGSSGLIIVRALMGLGEGVTFPAICVLLSKWIPQNERSKLGSLVFGGGQVGSICGIFISGFVIAVFDWKAVFYIFGIAGLFWVILFEFICFEDPDSHPYISLDEKKFLLDEIGSTKRDANLPSSPLWAIISSCPVIALVFAQIGHDFGFYVLATDLPKYMNDVLGFKITTNSILSALPPALMWVVTIASGILSDHLINRNCMTITNARKLWTAIAAVIPSFCLIIASYAGCRRALVVIFFILTMGFMGTYYPGMKVNPLDLSPNYAGTVMAISNGIGSVTGIVVPVFIGLLTKDGTLDQWRGVFWGTFGVLIITTIIYVIWASAEIQPWNDPVKYYADREITLAENKKKKLEKMKAKEIANQKKNNN